MARSSPRRIWPVRDCVMTNLERARQYAAIFLNVGNRWTFYVPLDGTMGDGEFYLHGVRMRPVGDTWELTENGRTLIVGRVRAATTAPPASAGAP